MIEALARVVFFVYRTAINPVYENATLEGASGFWLDCWGLMLGVVRKRAVKTAGYFTGTAYGDGSIPAGAWAVSDGTGLRYKVTEKTTFTEGAHFALPVEAEFTGSGYNIEAGMKIRLTRVVPGLDGVAVGPDWLDATGDDDEADDAYRTRIKNRLLGGVAAHELLGFDVEIRAPTLVAVAVALEYARTAPASAVQAAVEGYIHDIGIGGRFSVRDVYKALEALDLVSCEVLSPDRDVRLGAAEIAVASVTITRLGGG